MIKQAATTDMLVENRDIDPGVPTKNPKCGKDIPTFKLGRKHLKGEAVEPVDCHALLNRPLARAVNY